MKTLLLLALTVFPLFAQVDPGAAQDAEAEQKKLLRAADQIELLQSNYDTLSTQVTTLKAQSDQRQTDLDALRNEIAALKADNASLRTELQKLDAARAEERKVLLAEVGKIVADSSSGSGHKSALAPASAPTPAASNDSGTNSSGDQTGFEYIVKKGDTLHAIAAAYDANGVHVTVAEIRKANNMTKDQVIHTGQKLFIPKS